MPRGAGGNAEAVGAVLIVVPVLEVGALAAVIEQAGPGENAEDAARLYGAEHRKRSVYDCAFTLNGYINDRGSDWK